METRETQAITFRPNISQYAAVTGDDEISQRRLNILLELNKEIDREKWLYGSDRERLEAEMMRNPLDSEKTFAHYGVLLGTFTPAAIFFRYLIEVRPRNSVELWMITLMSVSILLSAVVGHFSGKLVGTLVRTFERRSWSRMIVTMPLIGLLWGIIAGGAGGFMIFVIGAFFGAIVGGAVGALVLPAFVMLHRLLKRGDLIEQGHFLPLAFGITLTICTFILGL